MSLNENEIFDYFELVEPESFFKNWSNEEFIVWVTRPGSTKAYWITMLKTLEKSEMYEFCKLLKEVIKTSDEVSEKF